MYQDIEKLKNMASSIAVFNQKLNSIHFNYKGNEFLSVHKLTEKLYKELLELYDLYSEKVVQLGGIAPGSLEEHLKRTFINEVKWKESSLQVIVKDISDDLTIFINKLQKMESFSTIDPLNDEFYLIADKYRWLIKAFIK